MRQEAFRAKAESRWLRTENTITGLDRGQKNAVATFPALYRQLCHDLAVARDRQFDASLVNRLNRLAVRGHQHLYRVKSFPWKGRPCSFGSVFRAPCAGRG